MNYTKKLINKIENPQRLGFFTEEEALMKHMRLVTGKQGQISEGNKIAIYLLIDEHDGVITDAKFQVFGEPALMGAAEVACEWLLQRNYVQARDLSVELIDKQVRDKQDISTFPDSCISLLNSLLCAVNEAVLQCRDIPIEAIYEPSPISSDVGTEVIIYPGWETFNTQQRIALIEEVIAEEIRPYIELDAGGVQVVDLVDGKEVIIVYEGACTSCHSATGSTLNAIQQILRSKIHPDLVVVPE